MPTIRKPARQNKQPKYFEIIGAVLVLFVVLGIIWGLAEAYQIGYVNGETHAIQAYEAK